jgi:heat shock protein HslJ
MLCGDWIKAMKSRLALLFPLLLLGCSDETISGYADRTAVYGLIELDGAPFSPPATISFPEPGRAAGEGPCNAWFATQSAPYPWIELGPIGATRRACPELEAEARFFEALSQVSLAEVLGPILILTTEDGAELVFEAVEDR